jgi:hypothetical protein
MTQIVLLWSAVALMALATVAFFAGFAFRKLTGESAGAWLLGAAIVPLGATLALRWAEVGHGPYQTRYEVIAANAFVLVLAWGAAALLANGLRGLGVFVAPAALLLLGWASGSFGLKKDVPIIFKSGWLFLHIGFADLFFAAIVLAALCAAAYLARARRPASLARLPSPERLDLYSHQLALVSFLFLGVMIVAGSLWARARGHPAPPGAAPLAAAADGLPDVRRARVRRRHLVRRGHRRAHDPRLLHGRAVSSVVLDPSAVEDGSEIRTGVAERAGASGARSEA